MPEEILRLGVDPGAAVRGYRQFSDAGDRAALSARSVASAAIYAGQAIAASFAFRAVIRSTIEQQNALAQLEARIKSTGGAAGKTVPQLAAFAAALQKTTIFGDQATESAQALLLTFKAIRGDTFDAATRATLDLATAMGTDLRSAALQVGKALEDPATQMSYLRRSGVSFTQSQIELAKHLQATGDLAGAQAIVLKELQSQFGGAAEAARNTLGGALAYAKNQWGDLLEASEESSAGIVTALNSIGDAAPVVATALDTMFAKVARGGADAAVVIGELRLAIEQLKQVSLGDIIGRSTLGFLKGGAAGAGVELATAAAGKDSQGIRDATAALERLRAAAADVKREMVDGTNAAKNYGDAIDDVTSSTDDLTEAQKRAQEALARTLMVGANVTGPTLPQGPISDDAIRRYDDFQKAQERVADGTITLFHLTAQFRTELDNTGDEVDHLGENLVAVFSTIGQAVGRNSSDMVAALQDVVYQLKLMERQAKLTEGQMKAVGYAQAGLGGFGAGYSAGSGTTSRWGGAARGAASGAAYGAAVGSVIPGVGTVIGAGIGGITGAIGGFLGASKAAKEAEEARVRAIQELIRVTNQAITQDKIRLFEEDRAAADRATTFRNDLRAREAAQAGDERAALGFQWGERARQELANAQDLLMRGKITQEEFDHLKAVLEEEYGQAIEDLAQRASDAAQAINEAAGNLIVRGLRGTGRGDEADIFALRVAQASERYQIGRDSPQLLPLLDIVQRTDMLNLKSDQQIQAINDAASEQVAKYDEQIAVLQQQVAQQEQTRRAAEQMRDSLASFRTSLLVGPQSPLSASDQLQAARGQFRGLLGTGASAQMIQGAASTYLQALSAYTPKGTAGYAAGFAEIVKGITQAEKEFAQQARGTGSAESQLSALTAIRDAIIADAERRTAVIEQARDLAHEDAYNQLQGFEDLKFSSSSTVTELQDANATLRNQLAVLQEGFRRAVEELAALREEMNRNTKATQDNSELDRSRGPGVTV